MKKIQITVSIVYLSAVIACLLLAFDFQGEVNLNWAFALIALTLPCSAISIVFVWGLIHGAGLDFFTLFYLLCTGFNIYCFNAILNRLRKPKVVPSSSAPVISRTSNNQDSTLE